jgi:hypothetical protein
VEKRDAQSPNLCLSFSSSDTNGGAQLRQWASLRCLPEVEQIIGIGYIEKLELDAPRSRMDTQVMDKGYIAFEPVDLSVLDLTEYVSFERD